MLKEILGASVSVVIVVYTLWFIIPLLKTTFNGILPQINQTSPTMAVILPVANSWFTVLPFIIVIVGGYVIYLYATRREGYDV